LEKFEQKEGEQVIDPQAAFIVSNIISDINARPAGSWRNTLTIPGHTVAAKTGTSNKKVGRAIYPNNNLIMGYTPSIVVGAWVGNTDGRQMIGDAWAFKDVGPIWRYFFAEYLKDKPDEPFAEPPGLRWIGRDVYPTNANLKTNFDSRFKRVTQETQNTPDTSQTGVEGSWIIKDVKTNATPGTGTDTVKPVTVKPEIPNPPPIVQDIPFAQDLPW
jgi:membrane peptidoglycan carboxypeptidase